MRWLTLNGEMRCGHGGVVGLEARQSWVRIDGSPVLVRPDPEDKSIAACPVPPAAGTKPCTRTLALQEGFSPWVFIDGQPVCREDARGRTDGMPAGGVDYRVVTPGQDHVRDVE